MAKHDNVFRALQKHLDKHPVGYPKTITGSELKVLRHIFTPKEARIATFLDYRFQSLDTIYEKHAASGYTKDDIEQKNLFRHFHNNSWLRLIKTSKARKGHDMGKNMSSTISQQLLTETAETVLARRYYLKDGNGNALENWDALCRRVADAVATVDSEQEDYETIREDFFDMIRCLDFLPNSPCLMNAGTDLGQLSACFVLPVSE